jgi:hypothetical protein
MQLWAGRKSHAANIVLAKAGQTEAVFQQLKHLWSVVRAGQATFGCLQIIKFFLFSSLVSRAGRNSISQPSPIPLRWQLF